MATEEECDKVLPEHCCVERQKELFLSMYPPDEQDEFITGLLEIKISCDHVVNQASARLSHEDLQKLQVLLAGSALIREDLATHVGKVVVCVIGSGSCQLCIVGGGIVADAWMDDECVQALAEKMAHDLAILQGSAN